MIKMDHNEIRKWYGIVQEFYASGLPQLKFCKQKDIEYKRFCTMLYRIVNKSRSNPEWYQKHVPIARAYLSSDVIASKFAEENHISLQHLSHLATHLKYLDIIEGKDEPQKPPTPMTFHRVPTVNLPFIQAPEPEIVEKRNDVELVITKGVKVIVSADLGTEKLIKIIELLKDL